MIEDLLQWQEFASAHERCQFESQISRIQKRVLLMEVSDRHVDLIHFEDLQKHWEFLSGNGLLFIVGMHRV